MVKQFFSRLFAPRKQALKCGGEGCVSVIDSVGREVGRLYYRRPTSDEILDYVYAEQGILSNEGQLREIAATRAKNQVKKIHEVLVRDLWMPRVEAIFLKCEGYADKNGQLLDKKTRDEQLSYLCEYYKHQLIDMCAAAFTQGESVKKKF